MFTMHYGTVSENGTSENSEFDNPEIGKLSFQFHSPCTTLVDQTEHTLQVKRCPSAFFVETYKTQRGVFYWFVVALSTESSVLSLTVNFAM